MSRKKSKPVAVVLNFFAPGLGHAYVGQVARGLAWALAPVLGCVGVALVAHELSTGAVVAIVGGFVAAWIGSMIDVGILPRDKHRDVAPWLVIVLGIALFVFGRVATFGVRAFFVEAFKTPSGSMMPTVLVGDHFFTDKLVYRKGAAQRGDVMVFRYPEHPEQDFVKRVVGVGGDRIRTAGERLYVNDWEVPRCPVGTWSYKDEGDDMAHSGMIYVEFLGRSSHLVFIDQNALVSDAMGPYSVEPGHYFVMGDNRNNAHDSRMWWGGQGGTVGPEHVKGRARTIWLSSATGASRFGVDLGGAPVAPSAELAEPLRACLAQRPAQTEPPPPR